ncbi:MAG: threonylcarbamoyladenosine tRNA methylthiotransferase MtaB, partial [Bacteroidota bacterium]|nr:threonylcarbamoyladenosine tRNA methylthiotransferase MtaB [Bacteroidota bacterium]
MRVSYYNIGCKVNYAEITEITELFVKDGAEIVHFGETADVTLINTCSVTGRADADSRKIIRRARRYSPKAIICVLGCYAQMAPGEIADIEGVDLVLSMKDKFRAPELIKQKMNVGLKSEIVNE